MFVKKVTRQTVLCLVIAHICSLHAASADQKSDERKNMAHASGRFEVKLTPVSAGNEAAASANLARMSIEKTFHGDLEGASTGEMISVQTEVKGSAGYVAMERVSGTLHGRKGTFVLQHSATMRHGAPELSITVVPDSGTGDLKGIEGKMSILIREKGEHFYDFEYTIE